MSYNPGPVPAGGAPQANGAVPGFAPMPGETVHLHAQFSPQLILRHLKTTLIVTDHRVYVHDPHTILGFIPHGGAQHEAPLSEISDVYSGDHTSTARSLYGVGVGVLGLFMLASAASLGALMVLLALILIGVGVVLVITARNVGVTFRSRGSGVLAALGGGGDRPQIDNAYRVVSQLLLSRTAPRPGDPTQP